MTWDRSGIVCRHIPFGIWKIKTSIWHWHGRCSLRQLFLKSILSTNENQLLIFKWKEFLFFHLKSLDSFSSRGEMVAIRNLTETILGIQICSFFRAILTKSLALAWHLNYWHLSGWKETYLPALAVLKVRKHASRPSLLTTCSSMSLSPLPTPLQYQRQRLNLLSYPNQYRCCKCVSGSMEMGNSRAIWSQCGEICLGMFHSNFITAYY